MFSWITGNVQIEQIFWGRPASETLLVGLFVAALVLAIFAYRKPFGLPGWVRGLLACSRLIAGCLLIAILFEPTATVTQTHVSKKRLPVLIDVSQSMSIKDQRKRPEDIVEAAGALGFLPLKSSENISQAAMMLDTKQRQEISGSTRLDLAKALISRTTEETLQPLSEDLDVSYYAFSDDLHLLSDKQSGAGDALASLKPVEPGTSIADSLEAVANADRGAPLAGVVLLTDGIDTSLRRVETAVNELGRQGIPVYTVPMGIKDPDDISIRSIVMQDVAFSGDKVPVRVQILSKGYEKRSADLNVSLNGRSVANRSVVLDGGLQFEDIFFHVDTHEKGAAQVEVTLSPFTDEATESNNRMERSVRVVNEKINVLCMEGSARWEFRYLRAMLKRDPRINATFIATRGQAEIARTSDEYIARFPALRDEAFQYDLVILGDVNSEFFAPEELALLEELIRDRGASLLMLAGARYAPSSYADTMIEQMLPVRFDPDAEWEDVDENVYPVLTPEGRSSLVLTLEEDQEENDLVWTRVAPMDRIPPLLSAKPGATVLAELSDSKSRSGRYPLVAWQRYGAGKCMVMGTDRLWLLRFKTGDKYHWRTWSQCIQFLTLSRLMGEHKRIRLETDRSTYGTEQQVQLYAHVLDDNFDPIEQGGFDINVRALDGAEDTQRVTLRPDMGTPGLYEGYFTPSLPGRYRVEANEEDLELSSTTEFQVADVNPEMADTDMKIERLERIAELSGGENLSASRFPELGSLIDRAPHSTTIRSDRPLWDNGWVVLILIGLMGSEWIVRRKYDLA